MIGTIKKYFVFSVALLLSPLSVMAGTPVYTAKFELVFSKDPSCQLIDFKTGKKVEDGKGNLAVNKSEITWTASCLLKLPKTISYCTISSQEVSNFDAFVSLQTNYHKEVLRSKIISDSDINPDFGEFKVHYLCFE
ncbi:MAG: hypothetical protein OQK04_14700 [Kangiellaceae bacterium]|nr:hypothetical protein [Kangiellaceae bacterium]MCW8999956.1 hypothetical protein [Kangiellaceae bacterium]